MVRESGRGRAGERERDGDGERQRGVEEMCIEKGAKRYLEREGS